MSLCVCVCRCPISTTRRPARSRDPGLVRGHVVSASKRRRIAGGRLPRRTASDLATELGPRRPGRDRHQPARAAPVRRTDLPVPRDGRDASRARRTVARVRRGDGPRPVDPAGTTVDAAGVRRDEEIVPRVLAAAD